MCIIKKKNKNKNKTPLHSFASLVTKQVEQFHSFLFPPEKKSHTKCRKAEESWQFLYQKVETNEQSFLHQNSPIIYYITITGDYLYSCTKFFILTLYKIYIQAGSLLLEINTKDNCHQCQKYARILFVQLLPKRFIY